MAGERYAHIYLSGPAASPEFTSVQSGGGKLRIPSRNRMEHAKRVASRLEEAWRKAGDRQAAAHSDRHGHYLEFVSAPGFDLALESLEARRSGIRLLNVRVVGEGNEAKKYATVYVPTNKSAYFLTKVRRYESEQTEKGNPKNAPLVESIDDVRDALLQAFWTDARKPLPDATPEWVEVWLSSDTDNAIQRFRDTCSKLQIKEHDHRPLIRFPERSVLLIHANRQQLGGLIELSDDIAEFRAARETASFFIELENKDQAARMG